MEFNEKTTLGRTGIKVGRLGISSSFGASAAAFEEAFDRGCNYFTWGTFIRGNSPQMRQAISNITGSGRRSDLVVAMLTYAHNALLTEYFFSKGLKAAGITYADVLLLGWFPKRPPQKVIDGALRLKRKGLVRFIGLTSHNRKLFPELADEDLIDVFHVRYNAAHRGAESETFPFLAKESRPGVVSFTATAWQKLLKPKKMPPGEPVPTAADCYRFALSHPGVDVCMMGAKNIDQMRENLTILESGPMTAEELKRMKKIGDMVYKRKIRIGRYPQP
ncbi:MAG: aldo/keto reductase [Deltaproteobacteria bacterium]|nr:aldo/keto reductase [Deltaproteobacteria bacterium]